MTRTALVTGFYGQDGSLLAEHLLAHDYRVIGVVRPGVSPPDEARATLRDRCQLVELDLSNPPSGWAHDLLERTSPDEIYYLAATHRSSDPSRRDDPVQQQSMVEVNLTQPLALAHALLATRSSSSIVVAASSQMYTPSEPALTVDENTPTQPATFYGVMKANLVAAIRWLRNNQGLRGSSAILFNHESHRRTPDFASRRITRAAARVAAGLENSVALLDLASQVDFTAAVDTVAALHLMARAASPNDYVVASGTLHTLEDLCRVAFAAVGLDWSQHCTSQRPPGPRAALVGVPTKLEQELGWKRARTFEQWVGEMVAADCRTQRA